jgi:hypothetical protein
VKVADAPAAGWYPDPGGRTRLRWWDGLDWTDHHRAPPTVGSLEELALHSAGEARTESVDPAALALQASAQARRETSEIIAEVRQIARSEVDRAAELFSQRAEAAARRIEPLVTEYTSKIIRLIRWAGIIAFLVLVVWFVFQFIIQASFFEWVGDRIDSVTNDE